MTGTTINNHVCTKQKYRKEKLSSDNNKYVNGESIIMGEVYVPLIHFNNIPGICMYQYIQSAYIYKSIMRQEALYPLTSAHDEEFLIISLYVCINEVFKSISL